ncbi:hypothetical protein VO54_00633 [Elizabethkingia miricola]|nr:hypothetical protein VO54_00633 [Elizabethkingia miricola]
MKKFNFSSSNGKKLSRAQLKTYLVDFINNLTKH